MSLSSRVDPPSRALRPPQSKIGRAQRHRNDGSATRAVLAHLLRVTVSMRVMSAGDGYKYLLRSVAAGDGDRSLSTSLTRYYTEEGSRGGPDVVPS